MIQQNQTHTMKEAFNMKKDVYKELEEALRELRFEVRETRTQMLNTQQSILNVLNHSHTHSNPTPLKEDIRLPRVIEIIK